MLEAFCCGPGSPPSRGRAAKSDSITSNPALSDNGVGATILLVLTVGEEGVQRRDDLRAFANCAGDALHRARADIANGEYAAHAGFQRPPVIRTLLPVKTNPLLSSAIPEPASQ